MSGIRRSRRFSVPAWALRTVVYGALSVIAIVAIVLTVVALASRGSDAASDDSVPAISVATSPTAVFIGDSFTQGVGASGPEARWVTLVALKEGWEPLNLGQSGSGYVAVASTADCPDADCRTFPQSATLAVDDKPAVVVIAGSQSDSEAFAKTPAIVEAAITATFQAVRAGLPNAKIIAMGVPSIGTPSKSVTAYDAKIKDAVLAVGGTFVNLLDPPLLKPSLIGPDGVHPNDAGYDAIAQRVEAGILP